MSSDFKVHLALEGGADPSARIVELEGDQYDQGVQHGEKLADLMRVNLDMLVSERQALGDRKPMADEASDRAADFVRKHRPEIWAEYQGMAEGSGLDFEEVLFLNATVSTIIGHLRVECSQYARVVRNDDGSTRTLIAKTRDESRAMEHVVTIRKYPDGRQMLEMNKAGIISYPGSILTNYGLALGTSGVWSKRTPFEISRLGAAASGTNGHHLMRNVSSIDEILAVQARSPRITGINNVVAEPGRVGALEVTQYDASLVVHLDDMVIRTNHYLTPRFQEWSPRPDEYYGTFRRAEFLGRHLPNASTPEDFWRLAQSHDGYPQESICRHRTEGRGLLTTYASIFELETKTAWIGIGNPCNIPFPS